MVEMFVHELHESVDGGIGNSQLRSFVINDIIVSRLRCLGKL